MDYSLLKATVFYNAGELTYTFPFDYIKKSFINIKYVDELEADYIDKGISLEYGKDYYIEDKTVKIINNNNNNQYICIYRNSYTNNLSNFNDGSVLKASDINITNIHILHLYEELSDYAIIHKIPEGLQQKIEEAVEKTEHNAFLTQDNLREILSIYNLIQSNLEEVIKYTNSINIKVFDTVDNMITSNNIALGALVITKGYKTKLDEKGALYSIEKEPSYNKESIKISNSLYAIKIKNRVDTNAFIYKGINIDSIINSYICFKNIEKHLITPINYFVLTDKLYLIDDLFIYSLNNNSLIIDIKKEGR